MSPPFWIHCNMCNAIFNKENKHYLLSCTHILCKSCMRYSNGVKCPLDKNKIRYEDINKLPEKLKNNFQPNLKNLLNEPAKIITFQQNHIKNMAKLTREYKMKSHQAMQYYEKEKLEILKLKKQFDGLVKQRRMMQEKLKEIYMRNKMKRQNDVYRNPTIMTLSSGFSSGKMMNSNRSTPMYSDTKSEFFNKNSQMGRNYSSRDFFLSSKKARIIEHTQSDRTPFFV